jgi:hypothetical protein
MDSSDPSDAEDSEDVIVTGTRGRCRTTRRDHLIDLFVGDVRNIGIDAGCRSPDRGALLARFASAREAANCTLRFPLLLCGRLLRLLVLEVQGLQFTGFFVDDGLSPPNGWEWTPRSWSFAISLACAASGAR